MERKEVLEKVQDIFIDILDDDNLILTEGMSSFDINGYDSLAHIQIVATIEKAFKIKFLSSEINSWNNIGELLNSIMSK